MRTGRLSSVLQVMALLLVAVSSAAAQAPGAAKVFNPDIAVIGDFIGTAGRNNVNPAPSMEMHESELSFHADVDPYAQADFFISFGEEGVELEEGYITFPALPGGFQLKVGKMRAAFGKVNTLHNHVLPWVDRPLVTENLVGGEDGLDDAGFSLSPRRVSLGGLSLEAILQAFRGDSSNVFKASQRRDVTAVGRLRGYADLTENTNLDLGFSFARGHNDAGVPLVDRYSTTLYGADAAVKWRPLARSLYTGFSVRSEAVLSQRNQPGGRQTSAGLFVSTEYQFARRWTAGGRYDNAQHADDASLRDTGESVLLTYRPSEFSQIRTQYRRIAYAALPGEAAHEVLVQFQFAIGAHGAHPFF